MSVVTASNLRKDFGAAVLFEGVSFVVRRGDRVALAGPNGAGKTTLLRMIAGETAVDAGELVLAKSTRVALHDQRPPLERGLTLREYVVAGAADLVALEEELRRLEEAMAGGAHDQATLSRYADAQARLEHAGGYGWRDRATAVVRGLGFADADLDRRLDTFSGGELTRASLARSLGGDPDLLLLDEPTNHLDVASLEWLERELSSLDAAVMLVAHDRWFLEAVTNATLELSAGRATYFAGPWHVWRREKAERAAHAQKTADRLAEDIARLDRFVQRFRYKKTKAKQAQAKLTQIGRLSKERSEATDEVALLTRRTKGLGFDFLRPPRTGRTVVEASELDVSAGDKELLRGASFAVERGEHVALVGPNGSGKTTLLETLLGRREPGPGSCGSATASFRRTSPSTRWSSTTGCPSWSWPRRPRGSTAPRRSACSAASSSPGWTVHEQEVGSLSGGERRRLALALLVASGANFLVLDEPTNHLDLESREALEAALDAFPGSMLLVSHDRALIDAVAERTLAIEDGTLHAYDGGWADLVERRAERERLRRTDAGAETPPRRAPKPAAPKRAAARLDELERRVEEQEQVVAARVQAGRGLVGRGRDRRAPARPRELRVPPRWETTWTAAA